MYSRKFKERMVRRMVGPAAISAKALSREVGIPQSTLSRWLRGSVAGVSSGEDRGQKQRSGRRERTPLEKAELVIEASKLEGEELGAFLRRNGLHEADLEEMRRWLGERLDPTTARQEKKASKKAKQAEQKRIRGLERELRKKEKALAEAAALLVLQKKVQQLWGAEDDDTDPTSGD